MHDWRKIAGRVFKVTLPLAVIAGSVGAAVWLYETKPQAVKQDVAAAAPAVTAVRLERRTVSFPIRSQGTVKPRRETTLATRVAGQVEWLAECFYESGFFRKGEVLVRVDRRDYTIRIQRLEASLRSAKAQFLEAQQHLKRQHSLSQYEATTDAALQQAQATTEMSAAAVAELEAQLAEARNAESDTMIVAPFDGCIQEKFVELGQFLTVGTRLLSCFETDAVEVRLPVSDHEFAFLGLPLGTSLKPGSGPEVVLELDFAGRQCQWTGSIVRSEAVVDSRSRMVYLVAQVTDPYEALPANGGQPLAVGMFVDATIRCPPMTDAIVLPESCVTGSGEIYVIDSQGSLQPARIKPLRREGQWIIAVGDVEDGSIVCATRLDSAVPGMKVQIQGDIQPVLAGNDAPGAAVDLARQIGLTTPLKSMER